MAEPDPFKDRGSASTKVSTPNVRYGRFNTDCRQRAMVDLPELDAPFSTMTSVSTGAR